MFQDELKYFVDLTYRLSHTYSFMYTFLFFDNSLYMFSIVIFLLFIDNESHD